MTGVVPWEDVPSVAGQQCHGKCVMWLEICGIPLHGRVVINRWYLQNRSLFGLKRLRLLFSLQKINQKFITNKEEFDTLQKIVLHEVNAGVAQVRNSATEALLWLKR